MRVAVVFSGNPNNMKGIMNYVHEKCRLLETRKTETFSVDFFIIQQSFSKWVQLLHGLLGKKKIINADNKKTQDYIEIENVVYRSIGISYTLWDNFFTTRLQKRFLPLRYCRRYKSLLEQYDIITTHTYLAHDLALYVKEKKGIPYICTWHGSDINVTPRQSPQLFNHIKTIIDNADCNLFVSKALMQSAEQITKGGEKKVIYTGPSGIFYKYTEDERKKLREKFGVVGKKVVSYVGNLVAIKNVLTLPAIFRKIVDGLNTDNLVFWIIGDGDLEEQLRSELEQQNINYVMFGKVPPADIPMYMNVSDLMLLISLNEGLGLVNMEAIRCGCNVVGSNIGGIPEVIGIENSFDLGEHFVDDISVRAIEILANNESPRSLPDCFSWDNAISQEIEIYNRINKRVTKYKKTLR